MPLRMTDERIADARARCEAASAPEWYAIGSEYYAAVTTGRGTAFVTRCNYVEASVDANFIAAARTDLPDMLADRALLMAVVEAAANACAPCDVLGGDRRPDSVCWAGCENADLCAALAALEEVDDGA